MFECSKNLLGERPPVRRAGVAGVGEPDLFWVWREPHAAAVGLNQYRSILGPEFVREPNRERADAHRTRPLRLVRLVERGIQQPVTARCPRHMPGDAAGLRSTLPRIVPQSLGSSGKTAASMRRGRELYPSRLKASCSANDVKMQVSRAPLNSNATRFAVVTSSWKVPLSVIRLRLFSTTRAGGAAQEESSGRRLIVGLAAARRQHGAGASRVLERVKRLGQ